MEHTELCISQTADGASFTSLDQMLSDNGDGFDQRSKSDRRQRSVFLRVSSASLFHSWRWGKIRKDCRVDKVVKQSSMTKYLGMCREELIRLNVWPKCTYAGSLMGADVQQIISDKNIFPPVLHIKRKNEQHSNTFHAENSSLCYHFLNPSQTTFPHEASFSEYNHT